MTTDNSCSFVVHMESGFYLGLSTLQNIAGTPITPLAPSTSGNPPFPSPAALAAGIVDGSPNGDGGCKVTHVSFVPFEEGRSIVVASEDQNGGSQVQLWQFGRAVRPLARIFQTSTSTGTEQV